eukprot:10634809-Prorocentrum_lima.AAC.1
MTSSLVGSEMCIRDRKVPLHQGFGWDGGWRRRAWWAMAAVRRVLGPVSYTHLTLPTICSV